MKVRQHRWRYEFEGKENRDEAVGTIRVDRMDRELVDVRKKME